jgi:putative peptidoglycan lipid II flippase
MMIPAMLGTSVDQINAFVDTICASFLQEGSVTALYYSNRVMQLPLALFGFAVASVSLPLISACVSKKDTAGMKNILAFSVKMSSLALFPAMAGLLVAGRPMIKMLFEHGNFDSRATGITSAALVFYSLGLPAFAYAKIFAGSFYSLRQTKVPVQAAALCMFINVCLNVILMGPLGVGGLALATSISSWLNASLLVIELRRRIGPLGGRGIFLCLLKIMFSTAVMSAACYAVLLYLPAGNSLKVVAVIATGLAVYVAMARMLKIKELDSVLSILKKEPITVDD